MISLQQGGGWGGEERNTHKKLNLEDGYAATNGATVTFLGQDEDYNSRNSLGEFGNLLETPLLHLPKKKKKERGEKTGSKI